MSLQQIGINMLINSTPEEIFITILTLMLLGRYDYLDKENWKQNLFKILYVSLPIVIISDIDVFIFKISSDINLIINIFLLSILISIITNTKSIKQYFRNYIVIWMGVGIFILTEIITALIAIYGLKISIDAFNTNPMLNFILFLPERVIQYGILVIFFIKKNSLIDIKFNKIILKNKIILICNFVSVMILILIIKLFMVDNILKPLSLFNQLITIIICICLDLLIPLVTWGNSLFIYQNEKYLREFRKED